MTAAAVVGAAAPTGLALLGDARPGGLTIVNRAAAPLTIARSIDVERQDGARWTAVRTEFNAVAACPPAEAMPAAAPVTLPARSSLRVVAWRGFSCAGQCEGNCDADIYLGPGVFRFVATRLPDRARVVGPAFSLPSPPARGRPRAAPPGSAAPPGGSR